MPESILDTIVAVKHQEVAERTSTRSLNCVKALAKAEPPCREFVDALRNRHGKRIALIAEVKKASPSAGLIRQNFDAAAIAKTYEASGADCLSVLTDEQFFQGHDNFLTLARSAVSLPVLRKDFIIDAYQVYEARSIGADAILLIAAILSKAQIAEYQAIAHELGMATLVEVHTEAEMAVAADLACPLIGINSRDLATFTTDLLTVVRLARLSPHGSLLVAESGIKLPTDIDQVLAAGAEAILVGETFTRCEDIGEAVRLLMSHTA